MSKKIVVASHNPVKVEATLQGFQRIFPQETFETYPISVASGVSDQPYSNREALQGAINRARGAMHKIQQADYWVGIEGGVEEMDGELSAFAWVVVINPVCSGMSRTGTFFLPQAVADLVRQGKELGEADDLVFGKVNSKQQNGAVGILTGDAINRTGFYESAVVLALIPFKNPEHYCKRTNILPLDQSSSS
jgi:inosine/xanthosine triphosphatase